MKSARGRESGSVGSERVAAAAGMRCVRVRTSWGISGRQPRVLTVVNDHAGNPQLRLDCREDVDHSLRIGEVGGHVELSGGAVGLLQPSGRCCDLITLRRKGDWPTLAPAPRMRTTAGTADIVLATV